MAYASFREGSLAARQERHTVNASVPPEYRSHHPIKSGAAIFLFVDLAIEVRRGADAAGL